MFRMEKAEEGDFRDADGYDFVGDRCSFEHCGTRDYLPFTCPHCNHRFCQVHAEPLKHDCPDAPTSRGVMAAPCPACKVTVKWDDANSNEEDAMRAHAAVCAAKAPEEPKKEMCPVSGCKAKLTALNAVICSTCKLRVCLAHRFEDQHNCHQSKGEWLSRLNAGKTTSAPTPAASTVPSRPQNWGSGVAGAASTAGSTASVVSQNRNAAAAAAADRRAGRDTEAAAAKATPAAPAPPSVGVEALKGLIAKLGGSQQQKDCCLQTLRKLLMNVSGDPSNPKFRVIKRDNKAIKEKILDVTGAEELIKALGFEDKGEIFELPDGITKKRIDAILQVVL
eukprot:TRINITY_DN108605_c0_g1_i1.p1 TRINITY_DN108605_c0_g1~~TRINITY_DN108605_c0_g1_i1.p1  ORF type:complete len:336 (+),score=84.36 TRINITY_DN108605_c0_g1_i1:73-1080(+)